VKVLFTSPALFGEEGVYGGGERYALELSKAVAEQLGSATLYVMGPCDADRVAGALRIIVRRPRFAVRGQPQNPFPRDLLTLVMGSDVVHCFQRHIVMSSLALLLGRMGGARTFATDLGGGGWDVSAYLDTRRWCTGLLHLSRYAANIDGSSDRLTDAILYGGAASSVEAAPGGEAVLFVGRLLPHKGADVLLGALDRDWPTTICGAALDEAYLGELRALAQDKNVRFETSVDDRSLEVLYRRAAVVVVPSVDVDRYGRKTQVAELLGLVAIEAAGRAIPVVASSVGSLPEIVEDGVTGFLVPPRDTAALQDRIALLLREPARRRAMGRAARERALRNFTWSRAAAVAVGAYRGS
jgi:glycosyltransferase involved in cell wall biosynthesis